MPSCACAGPGERATYRPAAPPKSRTPVPAPRGIREILPEGAGPGPCENRSDAWTRRTKALLHNDGERRPEGSSSLPGRAARPSMSSPCPGSHPMAVHKNDLRSCSRMVSPSRQVGSGAAVGSRLRCRDSRKEVCRSASVWLLRPQA